MYSGCFPPFSGGSGITLSLSIYIRDIKSMYISANNSNTQTSVALKSRVPDWSSK